MTISIIFKV